MDGLKVGELSVNDLKQIIKDSNNDLREMMSSVKEDISTLKTDSQKLREEVESLKAERDADRMKITHLEDQLKKKNLLFKGLRAGELPRSAIENVFKEGLKLNSEIEVVSARKIFERNGKMTVVVEFKSEDMVHSVLRNVKNLAGSTISIEQDLSSAKQHSKKIMLELKKNILRVTKIHRVSVRNDRMLIGGKWLYWNKDKKLMHDNVEADEVLKSLFGENLISINYSYSYLNELISKN